MCVCVGGGGVITRCGRLWAPIFIKHNLNTGALLSERETLSRGRCGARGCQDQLAYLPFLHLATFVYSYFPCLIRDLRTLV